MRPNLLLPWAALLTALSLAPSPAEAQGGFLNRVKEKVKEKVVEGVTGNAAEQHAPAMASVYGDSVLVMTAQVLDRFSLALTAEEAKLREVAPVIRSLPEQREAQARARTSRLQSEREWQRCSQEVQDRPENVKRREEQKRRVVEVSEEVRSRNMNPQAATRAAEELAAAALAGERELAEAVTATCGSNPGAQIVPGGDSLPNEAELKEQPVRTALQAGGFTARQYAILKERVMPFCAGAISPGSDGGVRIPGANQRKFYVYSPAEVQALRPRCGMLMPVLSELL